MSGVGVAERRGAAMGCVRTIVPFTYATTSMGGRLVVHVAGPAGSVESDEADRAERDARRVTRRVERWASRLTRHDTGSELSALNADPRPTVLAGPTLAAALLAARRATSYAEGLVDPTLLDARLAAEGLDASSTRPSRAGRDWSVAPAPRRHWAVAREAGVGFDLGGVAKGWIADRALDLLSVWPNRIIDADGDLAVQAAPGCRWEVAVDDPRNPEMLLAILDLAAPAGGTAERWGVATSGTSIHRWRIGGTVRHHIIDPRTGRPALTDVVQATVVARTALRAEALAKAAVIAGSLDGLALLDRSGLVGALVLTERGEALALPSTPLLPS